MQNRGFGILQQPRPVVYGIPANYKGPIQDKPTSPKETELTTEQIIAKEVSLDTTKVDKQDQEEITKLENNPISFAKNLNKRHKTFKKKKDGLVSASTCSSCG